MNIHVLVFGAVTQCNGVEVISTFRRMTVLPPSLLRHNSEDQDLKCI